MNKYKTIFKETIENQYINLSKKEFNSLLEFAESNESYISHYDIEKIIISAIYSVYNEYKEEVDYDEDVQVSLQSDRIIIHFKYFKSSVITRHKYTNDREEEDYYDRLETIEGKDNSIEMIIKEGKWKVTEPNKLIKTRKNLD